MVQRKIESMGAAYSQGNIERTGYLTTNSALRLDLNYQIAVKNIDLKELKDFKVLGDRLEPPKTEWIKITTDNKTDEASASSLSEKDAELIIFGESGDKIMYNLANCCKPIPGDDVFGFVTTGKGLTIHRTNCPNAMRNYWRIMDTG